MNIGFSLLCLQVWISFFKTVQWPMRWRWKQ
ncbi:hypothetical protein V6Z11_A10G137100 [Gossypium hirsutum]